MQRVLIVGVSSLVGAHLAMRLRKDHLVTGTYDKHNPGLRGISMFHVSLRHDIPWADICKLVRPDIVYYCAAERDERVCQSDPMRALALNAEIPANLARAVAETGAKFVYFSTSKVFSGERGEYTEDDERSPLGHYGQSKARGEDLVAQYERVFVLRLGTLYGLGPVAYRSLLHRMVLEILQGKPVQVIDDELRCFQSAEWVALAAERLLTADPSQAGLYHLPAAPKLSHLGFSIALGRALEASIAHLIPVPGTVFSQTHPTLVSRGRDTSLASGRFQAAFGLTPPDTANALKVQVDSLKSGNF
jgi:dTDP-4-dehydrorhamnose reductase